jgi:hypothetical protein
MHIAYHVSKGFKEISDKLKTIEAEIKECGGCSMMGGWTNVYEDSLESSLKTIESIKEMITYPHGKDHGNDASDYLDDDENEENYYSQR